MSDEEEFIMTIEDDDEPMEEDDSDDEDLQMQAPKKFKKGKQPPASASNGWEDGSTSAAHPWSFTDAIKDAPSSYGTSLQDKITSKLQQSRGGQVHGLTEEEKKAREEAEEAYDDEESEEEEDEEEEKETKKGKKLGKEDKVKVKETKAKKSKSYFSETPKNVKSDAKSFEELNLSRPLLKAVTALGYVTPTDIQAQAVPVALLGRDVCGSAVTGSGKTAAFSLPILERLMFRDRRVAATRVLILLPTRELAVQCHSVLENLAKFTDCKACLVVGGLSTKTQELSLRSRPDVVVATPGRMLDHIRNSHGVSLDDLEILVLDEADRLLELGFQDEVEEIVKMCSKGRQTMLFSATMTEDVNRLVKLSLNNPVRISANVHNEVAANLTQEFIRIRPGKESEKEGILLSLCTRSFKSKTIVFFKAKSYCHRLRIIFGLAGLSAAELHGNLTQAQRLEALEKFREGEVDFLLSTDLAARGLDILGVETVINMDLPTNLTSYIHRVGRTARAGKRGRSVSLATDSDRKLLKDVIKAARDKVLTRTVPHDVVEHWVSTIEGMEEDVRDIFKEEGIEKEMRIAEMEARKAENLIIHKDEIQSRPARTWFQTKAEKESAKEKGAIEHGLKGNEDADEEEGKAKKRKRGDDSKEKGGKKKEHRLTRKKRRNMEDAGDAEKGQWIAKAAKRGIRRDPTFLKQKKESLAPKKKRASAGGGGSPAGAKKGGGPGFWSEMRDSSKGKVFGGGGKASFKSKKKFKRR